MLIDAGMVECWQLLASIRGLVGSCSWWGADCLLDLGMDVDFDWARIEIEVSDQLLE